MPLHSGRIGSGETVVEDVFTGGVGIADDAVTIGFGWGLITALF